jgi:hypothetical protein
VLTAARQDTNVTGSVTASATFAVNTYTLTYAAGANGSIVGSATQQVDHGSSGTAVAATPATGYHFVSWSDGVLTATRTDAGAIGGVAATATFAINTYTLAYSAGSGGAIVGSSTQTVAHASSGTTVTATPATGYRFTGWSDGVLTAARADTNVTGSVTANAVFARVTSLTIASSRTTSHDGQKVTYSGTVKPNMPNGTHVIVEIRMSGATRWTVLSTVHTTSSHHWTYGLYSKMPHTHRTYYVRVRYAGSVGFTSSVSTSKKLIVN